MSSLPTRLTRIERMVFAPPPHPKRASHMIGGSNAECEARRLMLIDSGKAAESDLFIFLIPAEWQKKERENAVID